MAKEVMDAGGLVGDDIMIGLVDERLAPRRRRHPRLHPRRLPAHRRPGRGARRDHRRAADRRRDRPRRAARDRARAASRPAGCAATAAPTTRPRAPSASRGSARCAAATCMQRDDDTPDAVNRRLDLYESQTAPLIEYYGRQGRLAVVDGVGHPDHVFRRLTDVGRRPPADGARNRPAAGPAGRRGDWCSGFAPVALRVGLPRGRRFPCPSYRTRSTRES